MEIIDGQAQSFAFGVPALFLVSRRSRTNKRADSETDSTRSRPVRLGSDRVLRRIDPRLTASRDFCSAEISAAAQILHICVLHVYNTRVRSLRESGYYYRDTRDCVFLFIWPNQTRVCQI